MSDINGSDIEGRQVLKGFVIVIGMAVLVALDVWLWQFEGIGRALSMAILFGALMFGFAWSFDRSYQPAAPNSGHKP